MKKYVLLLSTVLCAAPALAQDKMVNPVAPVTEVSVTAEDCKRLVKHKPSADVAFQPGIDADGNPVIPAHGPGKDPGQIALPKTIVIDFGIDLAGKYGISGAGLQTATSKILTIEYDLGLGGLTVNGRPLGKDDSRAISKACKMLLQ